jgi:hypothetical protein
MNPVVTSALLVAVPLAVWFAAFGLVLLATRAETPPAAPATEDLGDEPPAVASFLVNHWEITEDAAESTLLDLGARHILEFRQPGNDPMQTTVHVRQTSAGGLLPYEQRVFDRVAALSVDGVIPLTALTFRDAGQAGTWAKRFTADVVADARSRGLSQRRVSKTVLSALSVGAAIAATVVATGVAYYITHAHTQKHHDDTFQTALAVGFFAFVAMAGIAGRGWGERDTAAGRAVASNWLGVRGWLRAHESFADLPPAAVAVWDRYLSYGAAVGATRVSSAVIDLGMGNRRNVWSSFGGTWHRVRVRYPRFWPRYGKTAPKLILKAVILGVIGFVLLRFWYRGVGDAFSISQVRASRSFAYVALIKSAGILIGLGLLGLGVYSIIRTLVDLAAPTTITGEVIWSEHWRSETKNDSSSPWLSYLAVDDGSSDTTRAWGLPTSVAGFCRDGDTVTIQARPWSRRVLSLNVIAKGAEQRLAAADMATAAANSAALLAAGIDLPGMKVPGPRTNVGQQIGQLATPLTPTGPLLTPEEVGAALGLPVTLATGPRPGGAPIEMTEFRGPDGTPLLTIMRSAGMVARIAMRTRRSGQPLPGLGDEGVGGPGWIAVRRGDSALILHLGGPAAKTTSPANLLALAQSAAGRMPSPVG